MTIDDYAYLSTAKLGELVRHLTRREQDTRDRLAAREKHVRNAEVDKPDPIRKLLFFLLLKQCRHRHAAEMELATRDSTVEARPFSVSGDSTASTFITAESSDSSCPSPCEHPVSAENSLNAPSASDSTIAESSMFETGRMPAHHVPARIDRIVDP